MVAIVDDNTIRINLEKTVDLSYDIVIGRNLFPQIARELKKDRKYAIITDSNVRPLHGERLKETLNSEGAEADIFSFEAGEKSKNVLVCVDIAEEMARLRYGRDSMILALGGGVVGDMAGWIAANYLRGIKFIQIATTILAQADSSVGGKTGVDLRYGKNLFGRIEQPSRDYIDVETCTTLPMIEVRNGLAECIKHGVIKSADYFEYFEKSLDLLLKKDLDALLYIARQNCKIKGDVIEQDPDEKGPRRILNFGHTIGHAVEHIMNKRLPDEEIYPHGYGVAVGMMAAGRIALNYGFPESDLQRLENLLKRAGLPTTIPEWMANEDIIEVTSRDKKAKDGKARYCLPTGLGQMHEFDGIYAAYVDNDVVLKALNETR